MITVVYFISGFIASFGTIFFFRDTHKGAKKLINFNFFRDTHKGAKKLINFIFLETHTKAQRS